MPDKYERIRQRGYAWVVNQGIPMPAILAIELVQLGKAIIIPPVVGARIKGSYEIHINE